MNKQINWTKNSRDATKVEVIAAVFITAILLFTYALADSSGNKTFIDIKDKLPFAAISFFIIAVIYKFLKAEK